MNIWKDEHLTPKEIKAELNNVHSTSAPVFATVYNGWMNLNVIVHPHVMHLVRDVQLRLIRQKSSIKSTILFWLIDDLTDWKCTSLLRSQAYHIAQWFQFCTNNWVWKSYRQDGYRVCSLWTISATVWRFQNNVWRCFNVIQMNFCIDSLLWTKHESITSYPRRRNSQNNRLHRVNQLRRKRRPKVGRKDDGHSFWDARDIIHIDITFRQSKQSMAITTQSYWISITF